MGFHNPGFLSPIRSDISFHYARSQSREELFICQCLNQGKEKFRLRQARSRHELPLCPGLELVQPGHPPADSNLWAKPQRLEGQRAVWGGMEHILVCLLPGCLLAWMKNKPMSCHPLSSISAASWCVGWGVSQAGELPPQPSANTDPWGAAWLWGNLTAAPSFPPASPIPLQHLHPPLNHGSHQS